MLKIFYCDMYFAWLELQKHNYNKITISIRINKNSLNVFFSNIAIGDDLRIIGQEGYG